MLEGRRGEACRKKFTFGLVGWRARGAACLRSDAVQREAHAAAGSHGSMSHVWTGGRTEQRDSASTWEDLRNRRAGPGKYNVPKVHRRISDRHLSPSPLGMWICGLNVGTCAQAWWDGVGGMGWALRMVAPAVLGLSRVVRLSTFFESYDPTRRLRTDPLARPGDLLPRVPSCRVGSVGLWDESGGHSYNAY